METSAILFLPVHLELVRMNNFLTYLDKVYASFKYLQDFYRELSAAKVFVRPKIKIIESKELPRNLTTRVKATRNIFVTVVS